MARPKKQSLEVPEDPPASAAKYRPSRWRLASLRPYHAYLQCYPASRLATRRMDLHVGVARSARQRPREAKAGDEQHPAQIGLEKAAGGAPLRSKVCPAWLMNVMRVRDRPAAAACPVPPRGPSVAGRSTAVPMPRIGRTSSLSRATTGMNQVANVPLRTAQRRPAALARATASDRDDASSLR